MGPKVALAIVGSRPSAELQLAILQQDQAVLVSIPGIGKKLAERVIFELKEKVSAAGTAAVAASGEPVGGETEVIAALQAPFWAGEHHVRHLRSGFSSLSAFGRGAEEWFFEES